MVLTLSLVSGSALEVVAVVTHPSAVRWFVCMLTPIAHPYMAAITPFSRFFNIGGHIGIYVCIYINLRLLLMSDVTLGDWFVLPLVIGYGTLTLCCLHEIVVLVGT